MRLGGPVPGGEENLDKWASELRKRRYSAAYSPVEATDDESLITAAANAAADAHVVIAEVGIWNNPLAPGDPERKAALEKCRKALWVADRLGARCAVNIAGSRGTQWDGPHPLNLTPETFALIVEVVRGIIDDVKPTRTFYALEPMPWMYPDSPDSYLALIKAVDRKAFAVHMDPVNMVSSPQRFFANAELIRECFRKLGPFIRSCHAKDITLLGTLTTHLEERRPGLGSLDLRTYLSEVEALDPDLPVLVEHLPSDAEYTLAADHIRKVAAEAGIAVK
jgi:sugar phosphate isomerase/epimerase